MDIEQAVQEYIQAEGMEGIAANWCIVIATNDGDGGEVVWTSPDGQPRYISLGLLEAARILIQADAYSPEGD